MDIWSYALQTAIVSFNDQQVITGISIIIRGITQLGWGLDLYHWQTVANLAWFSAFTHILTLTVLRRKDCFHRRFKISRMIAMLILLVMLVVALYLVGYITTNSGVREIFLRGVFTIRVYLGILRRPSDTIGYTSLLLLLFYSSAIRHDCYFYSLAIFLMRYIVKGRQSGD
jgi:uncharacterized membrane protein